MWSFGFFLIKIAGSTGAQPYGQAPWHCRAALWASAAVSTCHVRADGGRRKNKEREQIGGAH